MTDVFISYSRRDTDFARRLFDALSTSGHESWVDWEGIPYSADWWREICNGIDGAETLVFIISPDSMASMVCNQEVAYARENNKRIVPVMHRQPDEKAMAGTWFSQDWEKIARDNWTAVKHLNWLFFREEDDFDSAFSALIQTIEQDPEHIRFHTRTLVRAREWQTSQLRDAGLLLRGEDLRQAEGWLEFNSDKTPPPTQLQTEYIRASIEQRQREDEAEQRQRQRLRVLVVVLSVLLVIALIASGIAINRTQVADANAVTAIANADRASTNESEAERNANQAATSAAEAATNAADSQNNAGTAESNANLAATNEAEARNNAQTATLAQGEAEDNAQTAVANADLAATNEALAEANAATAEHNAAEANSQVLAADALQSLGEGDLDTAIVQAIAANQIDQPAFQARRALYRMGYTIGTSKIIPVEVATRTVLLADEFRSNASAQGVAYTPDGSEVVIDAGHNLVVLDAKTGAEKRRFFTDYEGYGDVLVTSDGRYILAAVETLGGDFLDLRGGFEAGPVLMVDLQTGETIRQFTGADESLAVLDIQLSPDGRLLFMRQFPDGIIHVWDVETGSLLKQLDTGYSFVVSLDVDSTNSHLIVTGDSTERGVQVYDLTDNFAPLYTLDRYVGRAAMLPDQDIFVTSREDGLRFFNVQTGEEIGHIEDTMSNAAEFTSILRVSPNGDLAVVATNRGRFLLYDLRSRTRIAALVTNVGLDIYDLVFSPDSLSFASTAPDNTLRLWDLIPTERYARLGFLNEAYPRWAADESDALLTYELRDGVLQVSEVYTQAVRDEIPVSRSTVTSNPISAVSQDGRRAVLNMADELYTVFDLETGAPLSSFQLSPVAIALSHDGEFVAIFDVQEMSIRRADSGELVSSYAFSDGAESYLNGAEFIESGDITADASAVVIGTTQGRILLFSVPDFALIQIFSAVDVISIEALAFSPESSPDEGRILSVSGEDQVMLWDIATGSVLHDYQTSAPDGFFPKITFNPDGRTAAISVSKSATMGEITLWSVYRPDEIAPWLETYRAVRELTCDERQRYYQRPFCTLTGYFPTRTPYPVPAALVERPVPAITNVFPTLTPRPTATPTAAVSPTAVVASEAQIRAALANVDFEVRLPRSIEARVLGGVSSASLDALGLADLVGTEPTGSAFIASYVPALDVIQMSNPYADIHAWVEDSRFAQLAATRGTLEVVHVGDLEVAALDLAPISLAVKITAWIDGDLLLIAYVDGTEMPAPDLLAAAFRDAGLTAPVVTATPVSGLIAERGANRAELPTGGAHRWIYQGQAGERLTLYLAADQPANMATTEQRIERNLLDISLAVFDPDGTKIGENDDINNGIVTDSLIRDLNLPTNGEYTLEIGSYDFTGGGYTLTITSNLDPTATPTLTITPLLAATLTPTITPTLVTTQVAGVMERAFNVQISADDRYMLTNGDDFVVRLWDGTTGELMRSHAGYQGNAPAISPDGTRYLTNNIPNTVRVFDVSTGEELAILNGHTDQVYRARWSPDSTAIVTASADRTARVWDAATGEERLRLISHLEAVNGARYSPDGTRIMTDGYDNNILIWDAQTGAELAIIKVEHPTVPGALTIYGVTWSPDSTRLAVASDNDTTIHDANTGQLLITLVGQPEGWLPSWSPDGRLIATVSQDNGSVKMWDTETGVLQYTLDRPSAASSFVAFNPDGTRIATHAGNSVYLWDVATGEFVSELAYDAEVQIVYWSSDGTKLIVAADTAGIVVRDVTTGRETLHIP